MTTSNKVCPICEARNHRNAALCSTCGAAIADVQPGRASDASENASATYDYRYGETDLAESSLAFQGRIGSLILLALLMIALAGLALFFLARQLSQGDSALAAPSETASPTRMAGPSVTPGLPTATRKPSPPPTATSTLIPSPAPCLRTVAEGESLIAIIARCGHTSLAILPTVMALNDIRDETLVRVGREIIVPRPSPTANPQAAPPAGEARSRSEQTSQLERLAFDPFAPTMTPTLLPGLMWHHVQPDEDMIYIAVVYETNVKMLADLNPEIEFPLCDFGEVFGGPECTVQLRVDQPVRVPAPTPTITPIPTASGSATPRPSPTATFNAPVAQSPADQAFFAPDDRVTLRWVGTGKLAADEVYRIDFANLDEERRFRAHTRELFLIVPAEWQSQAASSHRYAWQVSVWNEARQTTSYTSEPRALLWQGAGQAGE